MRIETALLEGEGGAAPSLGARAVLRNEGDHPVAIEFGACALKLRAYTTPDRSGDPVWRSEHRTPWAGTAGYACFSYLALGEVAAGGEFSPEEFQLKVPLIEVLGDSLPDGRYHFAGVLEVNGDTLRAPAGEALLRLERPALPASRVHNALTFQTSTEVVRARPTLLRTRVTASLTHASGLLSQISRDCPVIVLAYRSRERRDAAPRSGAPDARLPRRCGPEMREIRFEAPDPRAARSGESFPRQQPGAPSVFQLEVRVAELLGDSLPEGRYFLAAALPMQGRTVHLAAGEAVLRR